MRYYVLAFFVVMIGSAAITNLKAPAKMPTGIAGVKPASLGLIRDESGVGDISITGASRVWRYGTEVTGRHPNRGVDFPMGGNN